MPQFIDHIVNRAITMFHNGLHGRPQRIAKIRRNADRCPVEVRVAIMESFPFRFRQLGIYRECVDVFDKEIVPFHLAEFDLRIKPCRVPVERIGNRFKFVPAEGTERVDEKSLPQVLTFGNGSLQLCDPLLLTQVWPLVTTVVDDASLRCSSVAWLYSPDLGTFPAKSPLFSGCTWQLFSGSEKSLLCEVHDGHRT